MTLYLITTAWPVTKGNHAGMYYLANKIKERSNINVKIYTLPVWNVGYLYPIYRIYSFLLGVYLWFKVKKDDTVWLMEYLLKTTEQADIAKLLKKRCHLIGLAHLVPEIIKKQYSTKKIRRNINRLDKLYVLGSSLKDFFITQGIDDDKIKVTFHYVDTEYYNQSTFADTHSFTVICMGNMQRDYNSLLRIVENCPSVRFIICSGRHKINHIFGHLDNVELIGYVSEDDLKRLMLSADVSLNVMKDTIGSNVIVSSLACGLPILASDVGSIRDYVIPGENGLLFEDETVAINQILELSTDSEKCRRLSNNARRKATQISLNNFIEFFKTDNNLK